jgi:hypothetical protein
MITTAVFYHKAFDSSERALPGHLTNYDLWLLPSLRDFCRKNPDIQVYFISNIDYPNEEFTCIPIEDYEAGVPEFRSAYEHMSSNPVLYERSAIERWLVLNNFVKVNNITGPIIHIECDVLTYDSVNEWDSLVQEYDFTLTLGQAGGCVIIKDTHIFDKLSTYVLSIYVEKNAVFEKLKAVYEQMASSGSKGGICDMTLLRWFFMSNNDIKVLYNLEDHHDNRDILFDTHVRDLNSKNNSTKPAFPPTWIWESKAVSCNNSNDTVIKNIQFDHGKPKCFDKISKKVFFFRLLHFIGHTKMLIPEFIQQAENSL